MNHKQHITDRDTKHSIKQFIYFKTNKQSFKYSQSHNSSIPKIPLNG